MMSKDDFIEATKVKGTIRDKVKPIDRLLEAYDQVKGNATPADHLTHVDGILDACQAYLNEPKRRTSERRPGVQRLLVQACQELLLWAAARNDMAKAQKAHARYLGIPSPKPSLFEARDEHGFRCVASNVAHNSDTRMINYLISMGADPGDVRDAAVWSPWPANWTALDVARAKVCPAEELALQGQNAACDSATWIRIRDRGDNSAYAARRVRRAHSLTSLGRGPMRVHPVDILMAATCNDANNPRNIRAAYDNLWNFEYFRPILGIAAAQAIGDRSNAAPAQRALRLFTAGNPTAPAGGDGVYNAFNNTLTLGSKGSTNLQAIPGQTSLEGTMIHELTHHAAHVVFNNDVMPFPKVPAPHPPGTLECEPGYLNAAHADLQRPANHAKETDPNYMGKRTANDINAADAAGGVFVTVLERCRSGYGTVGRFVATQPFPCSLGMAFEYIVGIPQAMTLYGEPAVNAETRNLLTYFKQTFIPRVEAFLVLHQHFNVFSPRPLTNAGSARHFPPPVVPAPTGRRRVASVGPI